MTALAKQTPGGSGELGGSSYRALRTHTGVLLREWQLDNKHQILLRLSMVKTEILTVRGGQMQLC